MPGGEHLSRAARSPAVRATLRPASALGVVILLAACSGPVTVEAASPSGPAVGACAQVMAHLPATVLDEERRDTAHPETTAAWGNPPITLRCGVARPAAMTPTAQCFAVNGVDWLAEEGDGGWLFTTFGRDALVEVGVPAGYSPEANALVDIAPVIDAHDPLREPCA